MSFNMISLNISNAIKSRVKNLRNVSKNNSNRNLQRYNNAQHMHSSNLNNSNSLNNLVNLKNKNPISKKKLIYSIAALIGIAAVAAAIAAWVKSGKKINFSNNKNINNNNLNNNSKNSNIADINLKNVNPKNSNVESANSKDVNLQSSNIDIQTDKPSEKIKPVETIKPTEIVKPDSDSLNVQPQNIPTKDIPLDSKIQFFAADNSKVEGVELRRGVAYCADGTLFSGVMNTQNKKGDMISISYEDGKILSSKINNNYYKQYNTLDTDYCFQSIYEYRPDSKLENQYYISKYRNPKGEFSKTVIDKKENASRTIDILSTKVEVADGEIYQKTLSTYHESGHLEHSITQYNYRPDYIHEHFCVPNEYNLYKTGYIKPKKPQDLTIQDTIQDADSAKLYNIKTGKSEKVSYAKDMNWLMYRKAGKDDNIQLDLSYNDNNHIVNINNKVRFTLEETPLGTELKLLDAQFEPAAQDTQEYCRQIAPILEKAREFAKKFRVNYEPNKTDKYINAFLERFLS